MQKKIKNFQQSKLFKEDLEKEKLIIVEGQAFYRCFVKKEKYDKLPSKDVK
ncbi:hypothetical protein [Spiroplasma endosymbiont of Agriotes lineatus]|uniref:hypothetical protein n=1 Tax=Spiroplasma endosymbiont of Agriotes lineatus TaxID=3077930 RepID=UPI0030CDF1D8